MNGRYATIKNTRMIPETNARRSDYSGEIIAILSMDKTYPYAVLEARAGYVSVPVSHLLPVRNGTSLKDLQDGKYDDKETVSFYD